MEETNVLTYLKVMTGDGKSLLCIFSQSGEGRRIQILFDGISGFLVDEGQVRFSKKEVFFDVREADLEIHGRLYFSHHRSMKKAPMSFYRRLFMKMKYQVDASYMRIDGVLYVNGRQWIFDDGYGGYGHSYGKEAPDEYLFLSLIDKEKSVFLVSSYFRVGPFQLSQASLQIQTGMKEYTFFHMETIHQKRKHLVLKKGSYVVNIHLNDGDEIDRKTLIGSRMERTLPICLSCHAGLVLTKKGDQVLSLSSDEATYGYHFDR